MTFFSLRSLAARSFAFALRFLSLSAFFAFSFACFSLRSSLAFVSLAFFSLLLLSFAFFSSAFVCLAFFSLAFFSLALLSLALCSFVFLSLTCSFLLFSFAFFSLPCLSLACALAFFSLFWAFAFFSLACFSAFAFFSLACFSAFFFFSCFTFCSACDLIHSSFLFLKSAKALSFFVPFSRVVGEGNKLPKVFVPACVKLVLRSLRVGSPTSATSVLGILVTSLKSVKSDCPASMFSSRADRHPSNINDAIRYPRARIMTMRFGPM